MYEITVLRPKNIFRKMLIVSFAIFTLLNLSGCGLTARSPVGLGAIYTNVKAPTYVSDSSEIPFCTLLKTGKVECSNILGLFAYGDCSIRAAMTKSGIKKVYYIDTETKSFLFFMVTTTIIIYGE